MIKYFFGLSLAIFIILLTVLAANFVALGFVPIVERLAFVTQGAFWLTMGLAIAGAYAEEDDD